MRKQPFSRQSEEKRNFVLKIAIVDDLKLDAEQLSHLIFSYMKEHRIPTAAPEIFPNGETFLASFTVGSFDIVFLDIYMDGLSGMETAQKLHALDASCRIVFVTTSPDFAVDSYDVNAAFYLLKPVTMERVSKALERCHLSAAEAEVSVLVPCQGTELRLPLHQISYTEYLKRRILVHMRDRSQHEISMNQRDFSALLLSYPWFCDCIKGVLVNLEDVDKLLEDRFLMKSGASIPISRLKYRDVREQYIQYSYHLVRGGPHL